MDNNFLESEDVLKKRLLYYTRLLNKDLINNPEINPEVFKYISLYFKFWGEFFLAKFWLDEAIKLCKSIEGNTHGI
jgi:hypothetical protein